MRFVEFEIGRRQHRQSNRRQRENEKPDRARDRHTEWSRASGLRVWRWQAECMPFNQTRVPCVNVRRPFPRHRSPNPLEQSQHEQRFTSRQKPRREDVAGPMRPEINSRVTDGCGNNPVEPAAPPIKQRAIDSNYRVVRHMARWK